MVLPMCFREPSPPPTWRSRHVLPMVISALWTCICSVTWGHSQHGLAPFQFTSPEGLRENPWNLWAQLSTPGVPVSVKEEERKKGSKGGAAGRRAESQLCTGLRGSGPLGGQRSGWERGNGQETHAKKRLESGLTQCNCISDSRIHVLSEADGQLEILLIRILRIGSDGNSVETGLGRKRKRTDAGGGVAQQDWEACSRQGKPLLLAALLRWAPRPALARHTLSTQRILQDEHISLPVPPQVTDSISMGQLGSQARSCGNPSGQGEGQGSSQNQSFLGLGPTGSCTQSTWP